MIIILMYVSIHLSAGLDASVCHHITISDSICQGYLVKEGGSYRPLTYAP